MSLSYREIVENSETSNHNKRWLDNEDMLLMCELVNKCDIEIIAKNHKRTVDSIEYRKVKLAIDMVVKNKKGLIDVCEIFNFSKNQLTDYIRKYKKNKNIILTKREDYIEEISVLQNHFLDKRKINKIIEVINNLLSSSEELINIVNE